MNILSVQSHVAYGYVGNRAAVFPLQRLGFEVWPVNTVQFSNHTGYGAWTGEIFAAKHIQDVLAGIFERTAPESCHGVLSGYLGDAGLGEAILEVTGRVRAANPDAVYLCDPVIGDIVEGIYVRPGIPEFLHKRAIPAADIVTPNQFELELLAGRKLASLGEVLAAARQLRALGPRIVLVTSVMHEATLVDEIEMMLVTAEGAWRVVTPRFDFPIAPNGGGDLVAALYLGHYLRSRDAIESLAATAAATYAVFAETGAAASRELQIIAAQDELVAPRRRFAVEKIA
jgi:pyridoxine kinase